MRTHFSMQRSPLQWTTAVQTQQHLFCLCVHGHVSSLFVAAAEVSLAMEDRVRVGGLPGVSSSDSEPVPHVLDASDLQQGRTPHQDCRCLRAALQPRPHQAPHVLPGQNYVRCLVCRVDLTCHNQAVPHKWLSEATIRAVKGAT